METKKEGRKATRKERNKFEREDEHQEAGALLKVEIRSLIRHYISKQASKQRRRHACTNEWVIHSNGSRRG
jgi:hypothetical protein